MLDLFTDSKWYFLKFQNETVGTIDAITHSMHIVYEGRNKAIRYLVNKYFGATKYVSKDVLEGFFAERIVDRHRRDINYVLARFGLNAYDIFKIAVITRCINPMDLFWIALDTSEVYEVIFKTSFLNFYGTSLKQDGGSIISPGGINAKSYFLTSDNKFGIIKKRRHPNSTDIENEAICFSLSKIFNVPVCSARMLNNFVVFSQYQYNFLTTYLVHARHFLPNEQSDMYDIYHTHLKAYSAFLDTMVLFDFITNQTDRHGSNYAFSIDASGVKKPYYLYDNGCSLFYESNDAECQRVLENPQNYVQSLGLVGTYFDYVNRVSDISKKINLDVSMSQIESCFIGYSEIPLYRVKAALKWINYAVGYLKRLN